MTILPKHFAEPKGRLKCMHHKVVPVNRGTQATRQRQKNTFEGTESSKVRFLEKRGGKRKCRSRKTRRQRRNRPKETRIYKTNRLKDSIAKLEQQISNLRARFVSIKTADQAAMQSTRDELMNRIAQLEQESGNLLDHLNAITDAHQSELQCMRENLTRHIEQDSQETAKLLAQTSNIRDAQQEELRVARDELMNRITQLEQENSVLFTKLFNIDSVYQKELNGVRTDIERLQKEHEETSRKCIISENGFQSSVDTPLESDGSIRVVRELLSAYQRVGAVAALWLEGFHVNGTISDVDEHLVTLTTSVSSIVKVENNTNDVVIDTPNKIRVKLDDIQAVSDGD